MKILKINMNQTRTNLKILVILINFYASLNLFSIENIEVKQEIEKLRKDYQNHWDIVDINKTKGWKQFKRWDYFWGQRLGTDYQLPDVNEIEKYISDELSKNSKINQIQDQDWIQVGPFDNPIDNNRKQGVGRVNVIKINPNNSKEIWLGTASGGIWKSTSGGTNWIESKNTNVLTQAITDIGISPSNSNIIYIGTGDADGTIGSGGKDFYSNGIYKSFDGGNSWNSTGLSYYLTDSKIVMRILVYPNSPDTLIAATTDGLFISKDGAKTWAKTLQGIQIRDMKFNPNDQKIIYASTIGGSTGSIYKSTDGGDTWNKVSSISNCNRIALAVTPAKPNRVFALCSQTNNAFLSLLVSYDKGDSWTTLHKNSDSPNYLGFYDGSNKNEGQGMYDLCIAASPVDSNDIYIGGVNIWKSPNAGLSFQEATYWVENNGYPFLKSDQHDLVFSTDGKILYSGNDGGINYLKKDSTIWSSLNKGLAITQFYKLGTTEANVNTYIAGAQDNGTMLNQSGTWKKVNGADGMQCAIDNIDADIQYSSIYYGELYRKPKGQTNFNTMLDTFILRSIYGSVESGDWITPFVLDPSNNQIIYAGYNNIWKNTNYGDKAAWIKISDFKFGLSNMFKFITVSPSNNQYIYAATNGAVYKTSNGGKSWSNILNSSNSITSIAINSTNPEIAYITKSGFSKNDKVYLYKNQKIINISGNLQNIPINSIVYENGSNDRIYIGTDIGVYFSDNNSSYWMRAGSNLPYIVVTDMKIVNAGKKLVAASYGKGIWEMPLYQCFSNNIALNHSISDTISFCKGDSIILEPVNNYKNYQWSNGVKTKQNVIKTSGSYYLLTDSNDICGAKSEKIDVNVLIVPNIQILKNSSFEFCEGDSLKIDAPIGINNYLWSNGSTTRSIFIKTPGKYFVGTIGNNGCIGYSDTVDVKYFKPKITQIGKQILTDSAITYQWYYEGQIIPNDTNQIITPSKTGNYQVFVKTVNGCNSISDKFYFDPLGINNISIENQNFKLIPQPVENKLTIINNLGLEVIDIKIRNLVGKLVLENNFKSNLKQSGNEVEIDLSNLIKGIYSIEISTEKKSYIQLFNKN